MKGINFEEWKEIVKKNRRSLRSKSNSFKFEPESLMHGGEGATNAIEYGQIHAITYNVTGMVVPSSWPTEIKSGKDLEITITIPDGKEFTSFDVNSAYTYTNNKLQIKNIQKDITITIVVEDIPVEALL
jgi:hypothetical protein